jgi:tetratricopeptide (TPR) repeat protein
MARKPIVALLLVWTLSTLGCTAQRSASRVNMAAAAFDKGDYTEAVRNATLAVEIKPDSHLGYINRAVAYTAMRQYDKSLADYRKAIEINPDEAVTHLNYAELLVYLRRNAEAVAHAEGFLRAHAASNLGKLALAQGLQAKGDSARAYDLTSQALRSLEAAQNDPELQYVPKDYLFAYAYALHGRIAADLGKAEAQQSIEKAAQFRNDFATQYAQGKVYYAQRNYQWALSQTKAAYEKANAGERDSPLGVESRFLIGNCALRLGDLEQARAAYEEFIAANQYEPEAYFNLGQVYAKKGDANRAIESYTSALRLNDGLLDAYANRGSLQLKAQRYDDAVSDFSSLLARKPDDVSVLYKRAYAYCANGHPAEGTKDLREVLRLKPRHGEATALLGQCGG